MVVLDKKDYTEKDQNLLVLPAHRTIERDPTNNLKVKLLLCSGKSKGNQDGKKTYTKAMYPTSCTSPKFYGLPKIHKTGTPQA